MRLDIDVTQQISLKDLDLLKKLLAMTGSANDAEALSAARRANELLKRNGLTWEMVLQRTVTVRVEVPMGDPVGAPREGTMEDKVRKAFDYLRGVDLGKFKEWVDDVERQFTESGYLTPNQRAPLFTAVRRQMEKMGEA